MYVIEGEEWRDIPTYEGIYEISTFGRVHRKGAEYALSHDSHNNMSLYANKKAKGWAVHVLMGCTFLGNDINDPYRNRVLFKDGDSSNLKLENLYVEDTSDLEGEEWAYVKQAAGRDVQDFYMVSNYGRVKSERHAVTWMNYGKLSTKYSPDMILDQVTAVDGYRTVWLSAKKKPDITAQVHRLVASAFCQNDDVEHKVQVNHIDGDPSNNRASNLEWVTSSENMLHALRTGLKTHSHERLRYPVRHVETGYVYNSISDASRAMGKSSGYAYERLSLNKDCKDIYGNVWTLEIMKDEYIKVGTPTRACYFTDEPDRIFINMREASEAVGHWEGYVSECLKAGRPILDATTKKIRELAFLDER